MRYLFIDCNHTSKWHVALEDSEGFLPDNYLCGEYLNTKHPVADQIDGYLDLKEYCSKCIRNVPISLKISNGKYRSPVEILLELFDSLSSDDDESAAVRIGVLKSIYALSNPPQLKETVFRKLETVLKETL